MATEIRLTEVPQWCSIGPRPWLVTGFLVGWMRSHFTTEEGIEDPMLRQDLRGKLWQAAKDEDGNELANAGILIESITRWVPKHTGKRPAIIVARNDWEIQRLGINDQHMGTIPLDGGEHFSVGVQGSHTLFCLATKGPAAEILAMEVCRELFQFGPLIRRQLDLLRFVVVGAGKLFQVEESQAHYGVPITVAYRATDDWVIYQNSPFLKSFKLSMFVP